MRVLTIDEEIKRYGEPIPDHIRPFLPDSPLPLSKRDLEKVNEVLKELTEEDYEARHKPFPR